MSQPDQKKSTPAANAETVSADTEPCAAENGEEAQVETEDTVEVEALDDQAVELEAEPELTPEEILAAERDEFQEKWLRTVAELDNVRKRARREVVDSRRFAQADVLRSFLEIQDNFERALQAANGQGDTEPNDGFREGVELIFQRLRGIMKEKGVERIEALDAEFDPAVHEAVGQLPREGVEPGHVIEIVQQGYRFGEMVLRPARVIISS